MKYSVFLLILFLIFVYPVLGVENKEESEKKIYKYANIEDNNLSNQFSYYEDEFVYYEDEFVNYEDEIVYYEDELKTYSDLFVYYEEEMLYLEDELLYMHSEDIDGFKVLLLDTQEYLSSDIFPSDLFLMNPATADILKGTIVIAGIIIAHSIFPNVGWAIPFISSFQKGVSTSSFASKVIALSAASGVASGIVDASIDWVKDGVIDDDTFYEGFAKGFKWAAYTYAFEMGVQGMKYQFGHSNPSKGLMSADDYAKVKGREIINKEIENIKPPKPLDDVVVSPEYLKAVNEGVPLVNGHRDFSNYSRENFEFKYGVLTGNVTKDKMILENAFGVNMEDFSGCTLHHAPDGRTLMMVPTDLHNAVRHTGGNALIQVFTQSIESEMKQKKLRDYSVAVSGGFICGKLENKDE